MTLFRKISVRIICVRKANKNDVSQRYLIVHRPPLRRSITLSMHLAQGQAWYDNPIMIAVTTVASVVVCQILHAINILRFLFIFLSATKVLKLVKR